MLSRPRKPPSKTLRPAAILAVDPPGEVQEQLLEAALEPFLVALARLRLLQAVGEDRGPGMDRRIDVAKIPLVGRDLAVGVHVALAEHELELLLAEIRIDQGQGEHVEREVPGRVPGILPLVRHGDHVAVVHVVPLIVPRRGLPGRLVRIGPALLEPLVNIVVVELLRPEHPRQRLTHDIRRIAGRARGA